MLYLFKSISLKRQFQIKIYAENTDFDCYHFFVLHFRSYLYGALLDKPKAQPAGGKNPKAQTTPG